MKVVIIGFDGLDSEIVEKFKVPELVQKDHGSTLTPSLYTPVVWASFITGKTPEEHGVKQKGRWDRLPVSMLRSVLLKLGVRLRRIGDLVERLGLAKRVSSHPSVPTIFDYAESVAVSVPSYNEDPIVWRWWNKTQELARDPRHWAEIKDMWSREFAYKMHYFKEEVTHPWSLAMIHFFASDALQHFFYWDEGFIERLYKKCGDIVRGIRSLVGDDVVVFVVSDHGHRQGMHTNRAFWSSSHPLSIRPRHITNFFSIILDLLGVPPRDEEEKIKKHLRDLGYLD